MIFNNHSCDDMVSIFTYTFLCIIEKFVPHKLVTFNDRDAPWITPEVKCAINRNKRVYKKWLNDGKKTNCFEYVQNIKKETASVIRDAKKRHIDKISTKLCDPNSGQKEFWKAFRRVVNKKKVTNIPPLIENYVFVTNFKAKANIFNTYFADQCQPFQSDLTLPPFVVKTNNSIPNIQFPTEVISQIIRQLNQKKSHGCDNISIRMLQLCPEEIALPMKMIFDKILSSGVFPSAWKLANIQPVHKKSSRQNKSNYRPISLLPICSKVFEKIIFDNLYKFLMDENLLSPLQSGFRPGDSTINQLLSITTEIYEAFENHDEVRAAFLDISKAFDKVWHRGLLFKLKQNGISGNVFRFLESYLSDRKQRVVLNGIESDWEVVFSGVPQGSVLGPLLFLIYINDLPDGIHSKIKLFADDSSLFARVTDINVVHEQLVNDLETITNWAQQWNMKFNPDITKQAIEVIFSHKHNKPHHPPLSFNNIPVAREQTTTHLGMILDHRLSFRNHVHYAIEKANSGLALMKYLSSFVSRNVLEMTYKLYVRPHLDYGDVIFHDQLQDMMKNLESVQYKAGLIATGCWPGTNRLRLYNELGWESLADRRIFRRFALYYKIINNETPTYLNNHLKELPNENNMTQYFANVTGNT